MEEDVEEKNFRKDGNDGLPATPAVQWSGSRAVRDEVVCFACSAFCLAVVRVLCFFFSERCCGDASGTGRFSMLLLCFIYDV